MASRHRQPAPPPADLLNAIRSFTADHEYPPTVREIASLLDSAVATVHGSLVDLRVDGLVDWKDGMPRTLHVTG
jgi:repressor LexA